MDSKIVVLVPCYNNESIIEDCIMSLIKQDFKEFYIYAFDNCSTDKTLSRMDDIQRLLTFGGIPWPDLSVIHCQTHLPEIPNLIRCLTKINQDYDNIGFVRIIRPWYKLDPPMIKWAMEDWKMNTIIDIKERRLF